MTFATAAVSFHRRGTHRRLADRDFFQSFGPVFGDGDDGDDDDDDGGDGDRGGHTSSTCKYFPLYLFETRLSSYCLVDETGAQGARSEPSQA